jgi:hypothetical protein
MLYIAFGDFCEKASTGLEVVLVMYQFPSVNRVFNILYNKGQLRYTRNGLNLYLMAR